MTPLSAEALLDLWERGSAQPSALAAVTALGAATGEEPQTLARLPVGERDARLLALYRTLRGRNVEGVAACPACNEQVETAFDVDALLAEVARPAVPPSCEAGRFRATLRLPSTEDLLRIGTSGGSRESMRAALLRGCMVEVWRGKKRVDAAGAPPELLDAAEAAMERADPAGDIRLLLTCPACAHAWEVILDAAQFVWAEVSSLVQRVVQDVHALAAAYGWREADILAMSAARRQLYIRQAYG